MGPGRSLSFCKLNPEVQIGLIATSVILRQGQCSLRVLAGLASTLDEPLHVAGDWIYRDVSSEADQRSPPENRRLLMDSVSASIYMRLDPMCVAEFQNGPDNEKPGQTRRRHKNVLKQCFKAFLEHVDFDAPTKLPTLDAFLKARSKLLRMNVCAVLADYATGDLVSSSFRESAWLRWLGYYPPESAEPDTDTASHAESGLSSLPKDSEQNLTAHAETGDLDDTGIIADIREILRKPRTTWSARLEQLLQSVNKEQAPESPEVLLIGWISGLASKRRHSGKLAAAGTIRYMVGLFAARFLSVCQPSGYKGDMSVDELHDTYLDILEQAVSQGHQTRLASVITDFDIYYRNEIRPDLADQRPDLPVGGGCYEISANALSPQEYRKVRHEIAAPSSRFSREQLRHQALAVLAMAWRIGLRRSEMLGLERRDFHREGRPILVIRDNAIRQLKTVNGQRLVPLRLLVGDERKNLREIFGAASDKSPQAPFFQNETSADNKVADHLVVPELKRLFHLTTGDAGLHLHNLRHSAASWLFLALMGDDVGIDRYQKRTPFLHGVLMLKGAAKDNLLNKFHPHGGRAYAISRLLGHGEPGTSFTHYIHTLDLLLFSATDPTERHGNRSIQLAALRYSEKSRYKFRSLSEVISPLIKAYPDRAVVCDKQESQQEIVERGSDSLLPHRKLRFSEIELEWHKNKNAPPPDHTPAGKRIAHAITTLEVPGQGIAREAASRILDFLNVTLANDYNKSVSAIQLWTERQIKNADWASMNARQVTEFMNGLSTGNDDGLARFEAKRIESNKRTKINRKIAVQSKELSQLQSGVITQGRYWIRLRDFRSCSTRRKLSSTERNRQRTQSSVTWVVFATAVWLRSQ